MKDPRISEPSSSTTNDVVHKKKAFKRKREQSSVPSKPFQRLALPIDDVQHQLIEILRDNPVSIVIGETGSGKSTQIPQLCLRAGYGGKGMVGVTQPRRVAAISLATRVSDEAGSSLGEKVGYHVRFEKCTSDHTKICYLTDGILLREAMQDVFLRDYSVIIVDEAHERSLHTDVLLSVLRQVQQTRKDGNNPLRIVIMSATLQADLFSSYFDNAPVYVVQGRTFPVDVYHANSVDPKTADYVYNSIVCVKDVHLKEPITDDILVFLTGREEIELAVRKIKELNKELQAKMHPIPLFAAMSNVAQMKAFLPAPPGERKVVFATNIAETSLTIPGIRVVVDSGKIKSRSFTAADRIDILRVYDTSKAQAIQRAGRAGREAPGKCYRLYPESHYNTMPETTVPEILRSNLSAVILELIDMGLRKPRSLKLVESPPMDCIEAAERELLALGAVTRKGKKVLEQTEQGKIVAKFPLDPAQARVLLYASELGCLEEALWIVACMASDTVVDLDSRGTKEEVERARNRFATNEGDHLSYLMVVRAFNQEKKKKTDMKKWCHDNYLNLKNITNIVKVRKQLLEISKDHGLEVRSCGANKEKIRQALACGMFLNVCEYDRQEDRYRLICQPKTTLKIHPSSCLSRSRPRHIVFSDLIRTADLYARDVTLIDEEWTRPMIDQYKKSSHK